MDVESESWTVVIRAAMGLRSYYGSELDITVSYGEERQ